MMITKQSDGEFYLVRRQKRMLGGGRGRKRSNVFYNWFPVRAKEGDKGYISLCAKNNTITVDDELVGKRIRLRVEVIK